MQSHYQKLTENLRRPLRRHVPVQHVFSAAQLLPHAYAPLLDLAQDRAARLPADGLFGPAELLHEAFVRVASSGRHFDGIPQFFFAVAGAIEEVVRDERYREQSQREDSLRHRLPSASFANELGSDDLSEEIMMVDEAIMKLKRLDPLAARLVVLRYFNGLTAEETAPVLGISLATVERKWRRLKDWLRRELV